MKNLRTPLALLLALASCSIAWLKPAGVSANVSGATPYCVRPNQIANGPTHPIDGPTLDTNFVYNASCQVQPGDIFTDGPLFQTSTSFSGSSFNFTVYANTYIAGGITVKMPDSTGFMVAASTTTYLYLSDNAEPGVWYGNTTGTPPGNSVLMYTIVSNGSGITSITAVPYAVLVANTLRITGLAGTAGQCLVTTDTAGTVGATTCSGGGGGGGSYPTPQVSASPGVTVTSTPGSPITYVVGINNGNCLGISGGQEAYTCHTPSPQDTTVPSPGPGILTTGPYPNKISVDQTYTFVWTGEHTFDATADFDSTGSTTCNAGAGIYAAPICILSTLQKGIILGPQSGVWSGGSATNDSAWIEFCKSTAGTVGCGAELYYSSGGTLTFGGANISTSNGAVNMGTGTATFGQNKMGASCSFTSGTSGTMPTGSHGCKITIPSSPYQFTITYSSAYGTQAICGINDETALGGARVSSCGVSSAVITGTASGDIVDFTLMGI